MALTLLKTSAGDQFKARLQQALDQWSGHLGDLLWNIALLLVGYLLMQLILRFVSHLTSAAMHEERYHRTQRQGRRVDTVLTLTRSVARYGLYFLYLYLALRILGVDTGLLAAAGIGSFAIGFGAQSLVKDVINGFFMMFENQFSVGDYVKIDDVEGTVEATAMRVTYLRTYQGQQVILPNGSISRVTNYSRGDAKALVSVFLPYQVPLESALPVLREALWEYAEIHALLLTGEPLVRGILSYGQNGAEVGIAVPVASMQQWEVERGLRLALKTALDRAGIPMGYPHWTVSGTDPVAPCPPPPAEEPKNQ